MSRLIIFYGGFTYPSPSATFFFFLIRLMKDSISIAEAADEEDPAAESGRGGRFPVASPDPIIKKLTETLLSLISQNVNDTFSLSFSFLFP